MSTLTDSELEKIVQAVAHSVDRARLAHEVAAVLEARPPPRAAQAALAPATKAGDDLLGMLVLSDLLDDSILQARGGDKAYPLRVLLMTLAEHLATDTGLAFAGALNVYFRAPMEEESRVRLGVETSRLFYRFCQERALERDVVTLAAPLLASVLSGELERVRFESVDGARVFDSLVHERTTDSDGASAPIKGAASFLCRVTATNIVRVRALVRT